MSLSFTVTSKGNIENFGNHPEIYGSFHDDKLQEHILMLFAKNGINIDPYDGETFESDALTSLMDVTAKIIESIKSHEENWPLTGDEIESFRKRVNAYKIDFKASPRDMVSSDLEELVRLCEMAVKTNEKLVFIGD